MKNSKLIVSAAVAISAILGIGAAAAADLPARPYTKAPAMVADIYNWTGFYIGIEGGGAWGRSQHYFNDPSVPVDIGLAQTGGIDLSGGLIGGTVGYNYQVGNIVLGVENDLSWTNNRGSASLIPPFVITETAQTSQSWLDTLRARLGYAAGRWLVFGTGGAAFTNEGFQICDPVVGCAGQSKTVTGWAAGAGVEYGFSGNWSAKLEYLHADFGSQFFSRTLIPAGGFYASRNVSLTNDIVRIGVNYRFGGPVVARY